MTQNNWVPVSKALVEKLPTNREFSEVEAMFSLTVNYDNSSPVSISGLASRWGWSRKKTSKFLEKYGLTVEYENKFNRHKRGQITPKLDVPYGEQDRNRIGTGKEQVEFIDSRHLRKLKNRVGTGGEQERNRKGSTITNPNPNPNPKDNTPSGVSACPQKKIIELYHKLLPTLPKVQVWSTTREKILRTRWREDVSRQHLEWWVVFFNKVNCSDFLTGRIPGKDFCADLEWLLRQSNFIKVIEGKYDNRGGSGAVKQKKSPPKTQREAHNLMTSEFAKRLLDKKRGVQHEEQLQIDNGNG